MNKKCPVCGNTGLKEIYKADELPVFQNKTFDTYEEAVCIKKVSVELSQCLVCGLVFNSNFDSSNMDYDGDYQNEQNYSEHFVNYLNEIASMLQSVGYKDKRIIEIGCGKGFFLEMLLKNDFTSITGFDPAYEGNSSLIVKDYYSDKYSSLDADLIVLRHVLEHIENPLAFLHQIAKANGYKGSVYIEVPDFDWIVDNQAFWDIYNEHCNYFCAESLSALFEKATIGKVFGGQYLYMIANLSDLKNSVGSTDFKRYSTVFAEAFSKYKNFLLNNDNIVIWGGGSKGITFVNLLDKDRSKVKYLVDINPKKQHKYIGFTGHQILPPDSIDTEKEQIVIVANQNYYDEIVKSIDSKKLTFTTLEKIAFS